MKYTKLLTIFILSFLVFDGTLRSQCSLITKNGSAQDPKTVCSPVDFTMNVWFKFLIPVDTNLVEIRFVWNDGTGAITTVKGHWNSKSDSIWALASHIYPPTNECSRTADAYVIFDGDVCTSSGHQEQTFSTWGTDEENGGVLTTDPVVAYFCEGENIVDVRFRDNSTFNCNINIEPDNPNRYFRWVQFIYSTYHQGGDRIPSITVRDSFGINQPMTDNVGNFIASLTGPIVRIPIPADGPNQTSYPISAPAGGVAGDIFEITMRNWNVCNPYDNIPTDGIPPSDIVNGDNEPIETTARIEIIAPPPVVSASPFQYCTSEPILMTASAGSAQVRWYSDSALTNLLHIGNTYNPVSPPFNLNNNIPGDYNFYVTSSQGICESAPSNVHLTIYQSPGAVSAGPDQTICIDSVLLQATIPTAGSGIWTTTGTATIVNNTQPTTWGRNLVHGPNQFRWTVSNGPCSVSDVVTIVSDRQPDAANAGPDQNICDPGNITLNASTPNNMGTGHWLIIAGTGSVADTSLPNSTFINPSLGNNSLIWRVSSLYGACPVTIDTVNYFVDRSPGAAEAGINIHVCEINSVVLSANAAINGGTGVWTILEGTSSLVNVNNPLTIANNLSAGNNRFKWTLASHYGMCPGSSDSVTITRDISPGTANAGPDQALCLENSDTLMANFPITGNGFWQVIQNPSSNPPVFSPNINDPHAVFSVLPGNEGLYMLQWTLQNGTCQSIDTVIYDFGVPPPPGFAGPDSSICGQSIQLKGNHFSQGRGEWRQISGNAIAVFSPNRSIETPFVTIPVGQEGEYKFEWRLMSGACAPSADTVKITFFAAPDLPSLTGDESCGPDSLHLYSFVSGANAIPRWYDNLSSSVPLSESNWFHTPVLSATRNYYSSSYDSVTGCESSKIPVIAGIYPIPIPPVLNSTSICGPATAFISGSVLPPAQTIRWTSDREGNIIIDEGLNITPFINSSKYIWGRALDTIHGCISDIDSIYIIVHPSVPNPVVTNDSSCGTSDFMLHAGKSSINHLIRWYQNATVITEFHISDSLYVPPSDSSHVYWVSEWNDSTGCSSQRVQIEVKVDPLPAAPLIMDTGSCGPAGFILKPNGDINTTSFRWYNLPIGGTLIKESDSINTGFLTSNSSYWVSGYNTASHCEGPRQQVDISIYQIPPPISITGPTVVLKNQSGVIFAANGLGGSAYHWTIPSGVILNQNMNDFVRLEFPNTGSFNLSVSETTSHGCPGDSATHPINVISDSILVDIGSYSQKACTKVDFELKPYLFGGTPPYAYNWTGDTAYLSDAHSLFSTYSPPGPGIYHLYLEVFDVNMRKANDSVEIVVNTSPGATILTKDQIVCVGNSLQIRVQTTGFDAQTHYWSGPVHNLSSFSEKEPVYTPHQPDTVQYFYTLTDINGCKAYDSTTIYSDIPVAYFEVLTAPGCSPLNVLFDNQSQGAIYYQWNFGDSSYSNLVEPTHLYINRSSEIKYYPVTLEVTSPLGCKSDITQYAMVWPNPEATLESIIDNSCSPANVRFFTTPGNANYYWDFGDGDVSQTISFNTSHIYEVHEFSDTTYYARVITESSLHCIDSAYLSIDIYAKPDAEFTVLPAIDTFPDRLFQITNQTQGIRWDYQWTLGDGRTLNVTSPGPIEYEAPGNYSITLVASSAHCSDSATNTIYLKPAPPIAKFAGVDPGCMPHTINLINNSEYADSYLWEFGDGSISTTPEPSYTYYQPGIYRVTLTVKGAGGEASASDTARVYILPNSFFDLAPRHVYVNDEPVNFFNLSENADVFEWDFGDGSTSTELNPKHMYMKEGTYNITLKVWTVNNCFDLYMMENAVLVEPSGVVEFPNAFRPASPLEENKVFKPGIIDHVDNYHLMIFNRWGELIFESFDQEVGWDGTYNGQPAKQDVYIWKVKGTYSDGKGFTKTGDVTLMY
jgi:gliding motility-associated-like protein